MVESYGMLVESLVLVWSPLFSWRLLLVWNLLLYCGGCIAIGIQVAMCSAELCLLVAAAALVGNFGVPAVDTVIQSCCVQSYPRCRTPKLHMKQCSTAFGTLHTVV